jgi:transglutaminase-like putative cysteine protease
MKFAIPRSPAGACSVAPLVFGLLALTATSVASEAVPSVRDDWYLVSIDGKKAGYLRTCSVPRAEGGYTTTTAQKLVLRRGTTSVSIEMASSFEEDAAGKLLGFRMTQRLSQMETETVGRVENGAIVITDITEGEASVESRVELDPRAVGPRRAEDRTQEGLKKPGDSVEVVLFVPEVRRFAIQKAVIQKAEQVDLPDGVAKLRRVTITQDILPTVVTHQWVDQDFETRKISMNVMGLELVAHRSTSAEVLAERFSSPPEVFLATSATVDRPLPPDPEVVTYRLKSREKEFPVADDAYVFQARGQELVKAESPSSRVVRVRKIIPERSVQRPIEPSAETEAYLRATPQLQSKDPDIVATSRQVVGTEREAWKAAVALERWVHENVRDKNLETAFATAREVMQNREGDCTEHAVLLAALLRAAGIPSRLTAGLVYHRGSFVGHMWTEVYVGEWYPLDATLGKGAVAADHIALSTSALSSNSTSDLFLALLPLLGNLEIEVVEVEE